MADKNRKSRKPARKNVISGVSSGEIKSKKSTGPRLPAALRKQLDSYRNPNIDSDDEFVNNSHVDDEEIDSDEGGGKKDLYEYEEEVAEEESKKNRRYDPVDNFEYQLPEKFKDEDVLSDDDGMGDDSVEDLGEDDEVSDDDGRHARLLHSVTGIPTEAFDIGKKRKRFSNVSESYPESEFNPSRDVLTGDGQITIDDLLDPLRGTSKYSKIRKKVQRMEDKGKVIQPPLPKPDRERVERAVAYDITKKNVSKWERLVKRNREAPTLYFDKVNNVGYPTVGAIASDFIPRSDFEKSISSFLQNGEMMDAYKNDGTKILEMNKISVEDVKDHQDRLAKMRSLLFRHEIKAKHVKKIKSKTYHRLKKKDKLKAASLGFEADPEAAKEFAEKQEKKRAEERMTLKHKNQGKWAKRVLMRGLDKQDEGTRAAMSDQLHQHNLLSKKMNTVANNSSSDDSSDEDDEDVDSSDEEGASKLVAKASEKIIKVMEEKDELPDSGVSSMPFMARALKKRKEAADEEANRALEEIESLNQKDARSAKGSKQGSLSGKRVFGITKKEVQVPKMKLRPEVDNYGSDNEDIIEENDEDDVGDMSGVRLQKDVDINLDVLREDLDTEHDSVLKLDNVFVEDSARYTSCDVSVFTSGSWKKVKSSEDKVDSTSPGNAKLIPEVAKPSLHNDVAEKEDSDSDDCGQMIDGMLTSGTKQTYQLPSNEELMRRAFAGDDVEEEFQKAKDEALNEENPEPEKPLMLPGWGQWTDPKKRGMPSWMKKEHADAKRKREEALKKRKDARLKHVIISEKVDKKAEKLYSKTLPYPFTSKEVFEQSILMPIGPDYNPITAAPALIRPDVVKKPGVIIDPIAFKEVNPHETEADQKQGGLKRRLKNRSAGKKPIGSTRKTVRA